MTSAMRVDPLPVSNPLLTLHQGSPMSIPSTCLEVAPHPNTQAGWAQPPHTFHVLCVDMVLHISHTRVLKKFLHFVPSSIVGVKLLQGEGDCFGGLLGACHPQGRFWLETYKGAPIHGHIEEEAGFRALLRQLAAQGASDCERNYGEGGGSVVCLLEKVPGAGNVHPGQKEHERKKGLWV